MVLTIVIVVLLLIIGRFVLIASKGVKDMRNVEKYGGLRIKYHKLIGLIMGRNPNYQLKEINSNNVALINTGMLFKLIEMDKKLQIVWTWTVIGKGTTYKVVWRFDEFESQSKMYDTINRDMAMYNYMDAAMTVQQAHEVFKIFTTNDEVRRERLRNEFISKYPGIFD